MELDICGNGNELVTEQYSSNKNYRMELIDNDSKVCAIACSGNGLYFPNTVEEFTNTIIHRDRYEWNSIFTNKRVRKVFGKIIYIRDVYKQWYVTGINSEINSIDRLVEMLQQEVQGYEVVTIGNSAGGYMATLLGLLMNVKCVYNFSGQYSLEFDIEENPFLKRYQDSKKVCQYYNLVPYMEASNVPILYFYPGKSENDVRQYDIVKHMRNIYSYEFDQSVHGSTMLGMNYAYVMQKTMEQMVELSIFYKGKKIGRFAFLYKTAGVFYATYEVINRSFSIIKRRIIRRRK